MKALGQKVLKLLKCDRRTDGQTDKAKTICLPQRGGDIIKLTAGKSYVINNNIFCTSYGTR